MRTELAIMRVTPMSRPPALHAPYATSLCPRQTKMLQPLNARHNENMKRHPHGPLLRL